MSRREASLHAFSFASSFQLFSVFISEIQVNNAYCEKLCESLLLLLQHQNREIRRLFPSKKRYFKISLSNFNLKRQSTRKV